MEIRYQTNNKQLQIRFTSMKFTRTTILLILVVLFSTVTLSLGATKGRIMTDGRVNLYKNDQVVSTITDQGPIDENALIACEGNCLVKMQGISLSGIDQSRFAVKNSQGALDLYIEKGKIYFVVTDISHQFAFFTPDGYYVKSEGFIAPASTGSSVKGSIEVTDTATEIAMDSGSMIVQTEEGAKTIKPGQTLVLAMANPPEEDEGNDPPGGIVPCGIFEIACKSPLQKIGISMLAVGGAFGVGEITFNNTSSSGNGGGSASPNQ